MLNIQDKINIRPVEENDRDALLHLMHFGERVHRHLGWRHTLEWMDSEPFILAEVDGYIRGALCCAPDPAWVAWIRFFAAVSAAEVDGLWDALWGRARQKAMNDVNVHWAAAINIQPWFGPLLAKGNFVSTQRVVTLEWSYDDALPDKKQDVTVRAMRREDLYTVHLIDNTAFEPLWQNSLSTLEYAFSSAAVATVVEVDGKPVAYQISTTTPRGGHLARLAVLPSFQHHGFGFALVRDVLIKFYQRGAQRVTVNTQNDNLKSLKLYQMAGFQKIGDEYPLYQFEFTR